MQIRDVDAAWAAGFFDGEGHTSVSSSGENGRGFQCIISIGNTNKEPLVLLQQMFGGTIYNWERRTAPSQAKPFYEYITRNRGEVKLILETIMPYLVVKKPQATLMLEFLKVPSHPGVRLTNAQKALKRQLYNDMRLLNQKGRRQ